jgi:hypothetical protein
MTTTAEAASALSKKRWANTSPEKKAEHMALMRSKRKSLPEESLAKWRETATKQQLTENAEKAWRTKKNKSA